MRKIPLQYYSNSLKMLIWRELISPAGIFKILKCRPWMRYKKTVSGNRDSLSNDFTRQLFPAAAKRLVKVYNGVKLIKPNIYKFQLCV